MLKTERTIIIPLEQRHLELLRKMRNDPSTWHWLTNIEPVNELQQQKWFEKICLDPSVKYFAIEKSIEQIKMENATSTMISNSRFIGIIRTDCWDRINRSVRIGLDIAPKFRKQGFGTEVFGVLIDYLFNQQNMHRLWFLVVKENEAARKLYEKLGFVEEGRQREALYRDGKYHNYVMMSLLKDEYQTRNVEKEEKDEIPF